MQQYLDDQYYVIFNNRKDRTIEFNNKRFFNKEKLQNKAVNIYMVKILEMSS